MNKDATSQRTSLIIRKCSAFSLPVGSQKLIRPDFTWLFASRPSGPTTDDTRHTSPFSDSNIIPGSGNFVRFYIVRSYRSSPKPRSVVLKKSAIQYSPVRDTEAEPKSNLAVDFIKNMIGQSQKNSQNADNPPKKFFKQQV